MESYRRSGAGGLRGPRAASGSPVRDNRRRARWHVRATTIDRHRVLRGYTQQRLAQIAHVDPATLSDLLRGNRRPTLGTLSALASALDLTLGDVVEFDDEGPSEL